ncbi:unnamed protein product [Heligmosomoides polygyrus]|uniref:Aldedh domain-containing protein n=1 Tax=Heligmosomoides polygyrus TaxID=6339 RepID=A0A183G0D8_HELPZ|nr:unnamed protein product [Heligmosomoides polygyrus]
MTLKEISLKSAPLQSTPLIGIEEEEVFGMSSYFPPSYQCGFVAVCDTVDATHAVRLLSEKRCAQQEPLYLSFLDSEKASDRIV